MRTGIHRVSLWLAIVLVSGCGSHGLKDPSFTPATLAARGLAIGGMVSAVGDPALRAQARAPLDSLLWTVLARELRGAALAPLDRADAVLDATGRRAALDALESRGMAVWEPDALRLLPGREDAPFLVFGRVDQDETTYDTATLPASGNSEDLVVRITTRRVGVTFTVYVLPEGRCVWSDRIVKTKSVGQQVDESAEGGLAGAVLELLFPGEEKPDFLPPAPFEVVARKVFREFASQIAG